MKWLKNCFDSFFKLIIGVMRNVKFNKCLYYEKKFYLKYIIFEINIVLVYKYMEF